MSHERRTRSRARPSASVSCALALAGCLNNPCPEGTQPDRTSDRCVVVDAGGGDDGRIGARALDATTPVLTDAAPLPRDAQSHDAGSLEDVRQPPLPDAAPVTPTAVLPDAAGIDPPPAPTSKGGAWPNHSVRFCWSADTVARSDFASLAPQVRRAAEDSWPGAADITLTGFEPCSGSTKNSVVVTLRDGDDFEVTDGYRGADADHVLILGVTRTRGVAGGLIPHAIGHVLGLADEHAHAACGAAEAIAKLDATLPAQGDCRPRALIGASDRVAARAVYGARVLAAKHRPKKSFDGDSLSDLLLVESGTTPGSAVVRVSLTGPGAFDAAGSGAWLQLSAAPRELRIGDYDGDGLVDLGMIDAAHQTFEVRRSLGGKFTAAVEPVWTLPLETDSKVLVGDFDRSGGHDVVQVKKNGELWLAKSGATGFLSWVRWPGASQQFENVEGRHLVGDFNGDGYDDLAFIAPVAMIADPTTVAVHFADVDGVLRGVPVPWIKYGDFGGFPGMHYIANFRPDDFDDFGYFESRDGAFWVLPSQGTGIEWSTPWLAAEEPLTRLLSDTIAHGDFDGARGDDLVLFDPREKRVRVFFESEGEFLLERTSFVSLSYDPARVLLAASSSESRGR